MKKTLAQESILSKELQLNGCITIKQAMNKLDISEATARRLFQRVEKKGIGIRTHGKISLPDSSYSFYRYETSEELYIKEKRQIVEEAVSLVKDGDVLFLDSGTTVCLFSMALNRALKQGKLKDIKVFTNSYTIINILHESTKVNLIGGEYRAHRKDFCGYITEKVLKEFHYNKCFLGTDGYNKLSGFTTTDFDCAKICEIAIENSDNAIVLMDYHKYNKASSTTYSKGDNLSVVISDSKLPLEAIKELTSMGINVKIARK